MTTTAPSAARATIQPVFTDADANRGQSLAVDEESEHLELSTSPSVRFTCPGCGLAISSAASLCAGLIVLD